MHIDDEEGDENDENDEQDAADKDGDAGKVDNGEGSVIQKEADTELQHQQTLPAR